MIITRATEYAIRAILHMSRQPAGEIIYKKDICKAQEITPAFLTKILQPLIKDGIVGSQRGVGGGFYLIKEPERSHSSTLSSPRKVRFILTSA